MAVSNTPILGAIIAGGRATRFGSDKAAALLDGAPLIERAARILGPWTVETIVVGRAWPGFESVPDRPAPDLGPLGGLAGALHHARARGFDHVLTIGCDMPIVPAELIERLVASGTSYCADAPILGVWPAALAEVLEAHLSSAGDRSIRRWADAQGIVATRAAAPLPNINTPGDLAAL